MSPITRVAKRLKDLRQERGMSQEQLAKRAGISRGYLARLEIAMQDPTLTTLERLAKGLRVSVVRLLAK